MKKHFKSKFFYIIITLALAAVIFPTVLVSMGHSGVLRSAVNVVFTPLKRLSLYAVDAIDGYASYFTEFDELLRENEELKAELADLREDVYRTSQLEEQYAWLSEYLEIKMQHPEYKMKNAMICGRESGNYGTVLMLDAGTSAGVSPGMPVITGDGVLGYIEEVGLNWSKAVCLLEASFSVGAYDERSGEMGVLTGDYELSKSGQCLLTYINEGADVKVGDRILTGGFGSIYPRGLILGYVSEIRTDPYSRSITAVVEAAAVSEKISQVMVIIDYES